MRLSNTESGSSLIEVLVTLFVSAFALAGMIGLQLRALNFNLSSLYQSQATFMAMDMIERIRTNSQAAPLYTVGLGDAINTAPQDCTGVAVSCSAQELAAHDLAQWRSELALALPSGKASIMPSADKVVITIAFNDTKTQNATAFGQNTNQPSRQLIFEGEI